MYTYTRHIQSSGSGFDLQHTNVQADSTGSMHHTSPKALQTLGLKPNCSHCPMQACQSQQHEQLTSMAITRGAATRTFSLAFAVEMAHATSTPCLRGRTALGPRRRGMLRPRGVQAATTSRLPFVNWWAG